MDTEAFRAEVRAWLEENCPPSMRTPAPLDEMVAGGKKQTYKNPDSKVWLERMASRGWTVPEWPAKYGGGGLSRPEGIVLRQEMDRMGCRQPLMGMGISMLGPAMLEYASEEQKMKYLPDIVHGRTRWCQGYSEPGAGSDLAGLQTKAEDKGDHYLVNGQKIWTSGADQADWMFCLVRTNPDRPKHQGISFVLFSMDDPGVEVRPIKLISGRSPFCETFMTDVKVDKANRIGEEGYGWTIAKALLMHERSGIGGVGRAKRQERPLRELGRQYLGEKDGRIADDALRRKIAQMEMDDAAFAATTAKFLRDSRQGSPGPASSMFKYFGTELNKRRFDLRLEIMGTRALGWEGEGFKPGELETTRAWLRSKANSIEGGTSEVQLNIISKRVLGLPEAAKAK